MQQCLNDWIKHPEKLDRETLYELRTLLARYPYFQTARLLYLKNLYLLHDIGFGEELRRSALYLTDRRVIFSLVENDRYSLEQFERKVSGEDAEGLDRTLSLINAFLTSLPDKVASSAEVLPVEVAADYTAYLMRESEEVKTVSEEVPPMVGQQLIDNFLESSEEQPLISSMAEDEEDESQVTLSAKEEEEGYFTEVLAKIYVKQQRYSKALEIIQKLNLKYPKKNAYFADQIRFLEKLIINTKSK
jgi:tetratricopeptide (TPR) repeat protein